jgi:hypothetical protein
VMDRCVSRTVSDLLHDNKADEDNVVDNHEVVDQHADEADSDAVERLVDFQVDERANVIAHVAREGGNVESQSVDADADGSDDCLAATSSLPPMHRCNKSRAGNTNHSAVTWSVVVSTCPNWLQRSHKVI